MKTKINILLLLLFIGSNLSGQTELDSLELVKLYNATNGEEWVNTWDLEDPVSEWYGIDFLDDRVAFIFLGGNNLAGHIPDLNLSELRTLSLQNNQLTDTIPDFTYLSQLRTLSIAGNALTGSIPDFTSLPFLSNLNCSDNELQGSIPTFSNCPGLDRLLCSNNQLSGSIPDLSHLEDFYFFNINNNQLSGPFPDQLPPSLSVFNCHNNNLIGPLPDFQQNPDIFVFNCSSNQLSGTIPAYQNLSQFEIFRCENNNLIGAIPLFENLPKLRAFHCSENNLIGELPDLSEAPVLVWFYCDGNQLTGSIPDYSYLSELEFFICQNNQLTGVIPNISGWESLVSFFAHDNDLEGSLPPEIPQNFARLECANNNISGCYPDYVCQLWSFDAENNPLMPWLGNHEPFCNGEPQIGAPCDDGKVETIDDSITEDCECNDISISLEEYHTGISITISPNPVNDILFIQGDLDANFIVQISDTNGKILIKKVNSKNIDMSNLRAGIYLATIILNEKEVSVTKKIILN